MTPWYSPRSFSYIPGRGHYGQGRSPASIFIPINGSSAYSSRETRVAHGRRDTVDGGGTHSPNALQGLYICHDSGGAFAPEGAYQLATVRISDMPKLWRQTYG